MKEWFKARNVWGAAITALSDEDAGRLAKAIWKYTMDGEITEIQGAGSGVFAMILMTLGQDEEYDSGISKVRAIAGSMGGKKKQENIIKAQQTVANDSKSYQTVANDSNCHNKNKNKNKNKEQESETDNVVQLKRFVPPTVDDVALYCVERHNHVNAEKFVDYYSSNGWRVGKNPMKDWKAAVRTWERSDLTEKDYQHEREFSGLPY